MAGFRDFQTGEVLTAANVNDFLMQQSVMKFADATARDTALGTAVGGGNALREGMVAYLDDTDEVLAYDGTAWGSLGLPLGTATPTDGQILAFGTATSTWNPTDPAKVLQVVSFFTTTATSTSSTSYVDTSLTATITPTSATSKVLVMAHAALWDARGASGNEQAFAAIYRGGASGTYLSLLGYHRNYDSTQSMRVPIAGFHMDSPATTSATTYTVAIRVSVATLTADFETSQNMVLMEIAA